MRYGPQLTAISLSISFVAEGKPLGGIGWIAYYKLRQLQGRSCFLRAMSWNT